MSVDPPREQGPILLVVNPRAGRHRPRRIERLLDGLGRAVRVVSTQGAGDARRAVEALAGEAALVIAAGGDGTLNEVLSGLADRDIPLAVVPLGTSNIVAKELNLPGDLHAACRLAVRGARRRLDVVRTDRGPFLGVAGAGFDAAVVHAFARRRRGHTTLSAYLGPIGHTLGHYRWPRMTVECDGRVVTERATQVIVANVRRYGGPFVPAPFARPDDGWLDVCLFAWAGRLGLVLFALLSLAGAHAVLPGVRMLRARRVRCTSRDAVPVQLDGEARGTLPFRCEIVPAAVRLAAP